MIEEENNEKRPAASLEAEPEELNLLKEFSSSLENLYDIPDKE